MGSGVLLVSYGECNSETHLAIVDMMKIIDKLSRVKLQKVMVGKDYPKWIDYNSCKTV
jgi:hypothetical protein